MPGIFLGIFIINNLKSNFMPTLEVIVIILVK